MFCKICFDSNNVSFNTHNVRDSASNVICPVLLNNKCKNCGYYGHTFKYCTYKSITQELSSSNALAIKSVKFESDVKNYRILQKKIPFSFSLLAYECENDNVEEFDGIDQEFCVSDIVWGVGHCDMIGVLWADACSV